MNNQENNTYHFFVIFFFLPLLLYCDRVRTCPKKINMEGIALFFALAFSVAINFAYLANAKEYKFKKYFTAFALLAMGLFLVNSQDSVIVIIYWFFTTIMLLISGAMNRERRGKKIFQLPTLPSFKRSKKSEIKKQYKDVEPEQYADSDSDTEVEKRERLIEKLQRENEKLRNNNLKDMDDLDNWEQLRKKKLE